MVVASRVYTRFVAVRSKTRSGTFCRVTPVQTMLKFPDASCMVRVPSATREGSGLFFCHFAQRRRNQSPIPG